MHHNKGRKQTPEQIAKRVAAIKSSGVYERNSKRFSDLNLSRKGVALTDEQKQKISASMKGKRNSLGIKRPKEFREKLSEYWAENKEKHNHYVDGKGHIRGGERRFDMGRLEYRLWREAVFQRDAWQCVECGTKGDICADHIKSYKNYPSLRYEISNGRTLCVSCHAQTDNYGTKANKENSA